MRQGVVLKAVLWSLALVLMSGSVALAKDNDGEGHVVRVDCRHGNHSLSHALGPNEKAEVVEFTGTCTGEFDVLRDGVTLRGGDASATIVGGPVLVEGHSRVTLQNFTVRDAPPGDIDGDDGKGIRVDDSVHAKLIGLTVINCGNFGIDINSSTGEMEDISITGSGNVGMALNRDAAFELSGHVAVTHGNGSGVVVSANASLEIQEDASLAITDNAGNGLLIELKGHVTLHSQIISDRNAIGINVVDQGGIVYGQSQIEVANNRLIGVQVGQVADWTLIAGVVPEVKIINNGGPGLSVLRNAFVRLRENTTITGNAGPGVIVDGGGVAIRGTTISGNNGGHGDVVLNFGAQGTFDGTNTIGTPAVCDSSSRSRGQIVCTPTQ
jgi:hypothetical protein